MTKESILLVDDEELLIQSFKLYLEDRYDVYLADSAESALMLLEKKSNFALVISDYDMPGMNGVELLNKIQSKYPDIVRILMTAFGDMKIIVDAVNESNIFRFLLKSNDIKKIDKAISDAIEFHKVFRSEKNLRKELQEAYNRLETDLKAAAQLQQDIQPPASSILGYSFNTLFLPSEFLSGDNFNYFQFDDCIFFYVLDVTGKGIPASMMSFTISKVLSSDKIPSNPLLNYSESSYSPKSPKNALKEINRTFLTRDEDLQFFTLTLGVINTKTGIVKLSNGGNRRPVLLGNQSTIQLDIKGMPIGAIADVEFNEIEIKIEKGEKLVLFSDGLAELRNSEDKMYSEERLIRHLDKNKILDGSTLMKDLKREAENWRGEGQKSDDITILCIEKAY